MKSNFCLLMVRTDSENGHSSLLGPGVVSMIQEYAVKASKEICLSYHFGIPTRNLIPLENIARLRYKTWTRGIKYENRINYSITNGVYDGSISGK